MIAVVTGSSGFIGSHLVDALVLRGTEVRALVRAHTGVQPARAGVAVFEADLLDDRSVRSSPVWEGATHVFHVGGATKGRNLADFRAGNVFPTLNLLAALSARSAPRPRVVLVSSQAAAGPADTFHASVTESSHPAPVEAYGRSKLEAEQAVASYRERLDVTIVRPAAVYGPRDRDFLLAFRQASGRIAIHASPRNHSFSMVHVDDLVRALLLAADVPAAVGRTYFVAGEHPVTWRTLYGEIARASGARPIVLQLPLTLLRAAGLAGDLASAVSGRATLLNSHKVALARPRYWHCDSAAARRDLHWNAAVTLQQGVRSTYVWYVDAGWLRPPKQTATEEMTPEQNA